MKSAGWSLYQVAAPVACIAFLGMVGSIVVNLHYAPRSKVAARNLLTQVITDNPLDFIEEKRFINEFPGYVIYMGAKEGDQLEDFWVWELNEDKQVKRFVRAATGQLGFNEESSELILRVYNATAELRDASNPEDLMSGQMQTVFFEQTDFALPLDKVIGDRSKRGVKISSMDFSQLMAVRHEALIAESAENTKGISKDRMRAQTQIQKNCAMAFSSFSLALFGIPLAIQAGRKETYANLAIALVVAMTYYFLIVMVTWLEHNPALRPDLLVWVPNLLFQSAALILIVRAARH
jgi:lipopolysaccharide export system permease protein